MLRKFFVLAAAGLMILVLTHCGNKKEVTEGLKTEEITTALSPSVQEVKGDQFTVELSDLKITQTVDKTTKEMTTTPTLKGTLKVSNQSKNILDVQGVTMQYLDRSGNPIPFKSGEKKTTVSVYWKDLQPGATSDNYFDVTVPMAAVKEKSLDKIQLSVVYIPTPLKREIVDIPVKMSEK
ncbi:MAG: hypothetical protein A2162_06220 [Deltaproteobacteria bacterium RBG_13_52_11b]|nr:MAG: hypothetical protein A2162_06220 [Deltaproteobacteria bacterium RBG_13_52_11b]